MYRGNGIHFMLTRLAGVVFALAALSVQAGDYTFDVHGNELTLNGEPFKILGFRCSNALISDGTTQRLIDHLDLYRDHGINTVSIFFMGSRFGDVQGYRADASLDPAYAERMGRIIEAADERGMVVQVGCLYWGTSRAKAKLDHWTQEDANRAVANTARWLSNHNYRNVFLEPDNENMAGRANDWAQRPMIAAAHEVDPAIVVASNKRRTPENTDLPIHFAEPVEGKPWLDTEATVSPENGHYWGAYSKETHQDTGGKYYN